MGIWIKSVVGEVSSGSLVIRVKTDNEEYA